MSQSILTDVSERVQSAPGEAALLAALLLTMLLVLNRIVGSLQARRNESGLKGRASSVSVDGSKTLPVRDYVSEMQGLAGRPDAVISEHGYLIPVERKPLARKVRDRYVAQLLVYMRLIEEFEGVRPPYGYLILGANCRRIKIENTEERQAWLQGLIDEMRGILAGAPAKQLHIHESVVGVMCVNIAPSKSHRMQVRTTAKARSSNCAPRVKES